LNSLCRLTKTLLWRVLPFGLFFWNDRPLLGRLIQIPQYTVAKSISTSRYNPVFAWMGPDAGQGIDAMAMPAAQVSVIISMAAPWFFCSDVF